MSRYYDIENLKKRVLDVANACGLKTTIFVLDNAQVSDYEFEYLKFLLVLEKE